MVQTKVIALAASVLLAAACSGDFSYTWQKYGMDGHRTGVTAPTARNVDQALGSVEGDVYTAPNGTAFPQGSATYAVARDMIAVQPELARIKQVVAYAPEGMVATQPESALSDWWVDRIMVDVARITGRKVDVGILNFGGIRTDLPQGDVLLEDMVSMFPFNNFLSYVTLKGSDLQEIFNFIAATRPMVLGGVKLVQDGHRIDTLLVGGRPIDPKKTYSVATVDFLLAGGDNMQIGKNAKETIVTDYRVIDAILPYVRSLGEAGKPLEYHTDGRYIIRNWEKEEQL